MSERKRREAERKGVFKTGFLCMLIQVSFSSPSPPQFTFTTSYYKALPYTFSPSHFPQPSLPYHSTEAVQNRGCPNPFTHDQRQDSPITESWQEPDMPITLCPPPFCRTLTPWGATLQSKRCKQPTVKRQSIVRDYFRFSSWRALHYFQFTTRL